MKHFNIVFFFLVLMSVMSVTASAYDAQIDGIYYNFDINRKTATVTYASSDSYNSYSGDVAIPDTVTHNGKSYAVTSIGNSAFRSCSGLTSVTIPGNVTTIGGSAFRSCSGLTSVTIPGNVTTIDGSAFEGCSGLTSATIPNSVTRIGGGAFYGCSGLTAITIPNSVTTINSYTFSLCTSLTSVTIPNSVTSIGSRAFYGCSGLTSVTIPNSVTSIGSGAFENCSGLTSVTIPNSVTSIGLGAFYDTPWINEQSDGLIYIGKTAYMYKGTMPENTSITIKEGTESISSSAFYGCSGLTAITIPNSVTNIGNRAFYGCSGLTSITVEEGNSTYDSRGGCNAVINTSSNTLIAGCQNTTIPNSVTSIGDYAFYGCSGLASVNIGSSVTDIGDAAFEGCSELTSITIPNSVTSIGQNAFEGCSGLASVNIGSSVTSIEQNAFQNCSALASVTLNSNNIVSKNYSFSSSISNIFGIQVKEYILGEDVTSIGKHAFQECYGMTSVTIPNSVTSIGSGAFQCCSGLTSVTIPNSVNSIGSAAFQYCSSLTSVTIPNSVTSIDDAAFADCSSLASVRIGNSVTEIPWCAFQNCTNLTSVVIGDGVYKINYQAFRGDKNLESIISVSPTPPIISSPINYDNPFETITYKHAILKVPLGCKSRYWSADYWKDFAYIEEMDMTAYREGVDMEEGDKASRYATFYDSQSAYTLPAGLKASVVTGMSSGKLVYKVIAEGGKSNNVVPKGVAVMLTSAQEDASAYTLTPTESDVTYTGTNWLYGSDEATTTTASGNSRFYKLSYGASGTDKSEVFGWYWGAANGGAFSIAGHKAWLAVPMVAGAPTRSFSMEGDATDIVDIETTKMQNEDEGYYDLQGRRVTEPVSKGIYIHKGKKIIIR